MKYDDLSVTVLAKLALDGVIGGKDLKKIKVIDSTARPASKEDLGKPYDDRLENLIKKHDQS